MNKIKLNINGGLLAWDGLFDILQKETQELTDAIVSSFLIDKRMAILKGCNVTITNSGPTNVSFSVSNGYIYYRAEDSSIGEIFAFDGVSDIILPDYSNLEYIYANYYFDLNITESEYIEYENGTYDNVYIHRKCIVTNTPSSFIDAVLNMSSLTSFMDEATTSKYGIVKLASAGSIGNEVYTSNSFNEKKTIFSITSVAPEIIIESSNCKTISFGPVRITEMKFSFRISETYVDFLQYVDIQTSINNVIGITGSSIISTQEYSTGGTYPYQTIRILQQTENIIRIINEAGYQNNGMQNPTFTVNIKTTSIL